MESIKVNTAKKERGTIFSIKPSFSIVSIPIFHVHTPFAKLCCLPFFLSSSSLKFLLEKTLYHKMSGPLAQVCWLNSYHLTSASWDKKGNWPLQLGDAVFPCSFIQQTFKKHQVCAMHWGSNRFSFNENEILRIICARVSVINFWGIMLFRERD